MPYVGRDLQRGNYLKLDDISSSFDGSTTTFNLQSGGSAFYPGSAFSIFVSVGGVVQEPESAYTINKNTITFANAPHNVDECFITALGVALGVGVPGHGTVNGSQLAKPFNYDGGLLYLDSTNDRVGVGVTTPSYTLDVNGTASFSGNVTIGGTLTYQDVASIDAVGIATFQDDVNFNGTGAGISSSYWDKSANEFKFKDNVKLSFGDDRDLQLRHNNNDSVISHIAGATGNLKILSGGAQSIECVKAGAVNIAHNGTTKLNTRTDGVKITGGTDISMNSNGTGQLYMTGNGYTGGIALDATAMNIYHNSGSKAIIFGTNEDEKVRITSAGLVGIGTDNPENGLHVSDGSSYAAPQNTGAGKVMIEHASSADLQFMTANSGYNHIFFGDQDDANIGSIVYHHASNSNAMVFNTNTAERLRIDSGGTTRLQRSTYNTGAVTVSNAALYLDIGSTEGAVNINQLIGFGYRNATTSAKPAYIGYQATTWSGHTRGDLIFGTRSTTTATDEATERLRISHEGKVGIGTVTPESGQLQVIGNGYHQINISGNKTADANKTGGISFLNYEGSRTSVFQTYASNSSNTIYYGSADSSARGVQYHNFYVNTSRTATTNHALALRINSDKTVGINTTNSGGSGLGVAVDNNSTNPLATGSIAFNLKNTNTTDNSWVAMDFNNSVGGVVGRFGAQFKDTSDKDTDLYFATRADGGALSEVLRITSDGHVRIQRTGGNAKLLISRNQSVGTDNTETGVIDFANNTAHTVNARIMAKTSGTGNVGGQLVVETRDESNSTLAERLRITSDGKIGIGEDDPDGNYLLIRAASTVGTTKGHIMLTGDSATNGQGPQIVFSESGSGSSYAGAYIGHVRATTNSVGHLVFGTRETGGDANTIPTERLRITNAGNVGINDDNPSSQLVVKATSDDNPALQLYRQSTGGDIASINWKTGSGDQAKINYRGAAGAGEGLQFYTAGGSSSQQRMIIDLSGRVGIGTDDPGEKLDVEGSLRLRAGGNWTTYATRLTSRLDSTHMMSLEAYHNSSTPVEILGTYADGGGSNMRTVIAPNGMKVGIGTDDPDYNLEVIGSFAATTKSFVIHHPTKENHQLRYACLEGPENSVYVRGRSSDPVIELPDYWVGLVHDDSITVNVTPIGNKKVWVESINNNSVTIGSDDSTEYFYTVFAERKDVDKLEVEVEN